MHGVLPYPLQATLYCWFALEVALVVRDLTRGRARLGTDRGTRGLVAVSLGGSVVLGSVLRTWVPVLDTPVPLAFAVAGLVVVWAGLAVRVWAVLALGRAFSTFVQVDADQTVVTRGPYRWVRHPSYTGLLLIAIGFGIAARNWLSLVVCAVVPVLGLLPRIAVEESELVRVLGEPYRGYQARTRRLLPGVW
ncbi:MAG TPA: isoprenylcysteine carboxylmethyltransferase family protein [Rugosimonospora sp.]|nr:isoprenylcysteine carboxylmethyltransferase family protein [Rugosimonospora sp.]